MNQTTYSAGIAAILADPDEKSHRRILADLIEETGNLSRAEFIRKCLDTSPHVSVLDRMLLLEPDTADLSRMFDFPWMGTREEWVHDKIVIDREPKEVWRCECVRTENRSIWYGVDFSGMIQSVMCDMNHWMEHGPAICQLHPVRDVYITGKIPHWSRCSTDNDDESSTPSFDENLGAYEFYLEDDSRYRQGDEFLPKTIFDLMIPFSDGVFGGWCMQFDTSRFSLNIDVRARSLRVLNTASLTWARMTLPAEIASGQ